MAVTFGGWWWCRRHSELLFLYHTLVSGAEGTVSCFLGFTRRPGLLHRVTFWKKALSLSCRVLSPPSLSCISNFTLKYSNISHRDEVIFNTNFFIEVKSTYEHKNDHFTRFYVYISGALCTFSLSYNGSHHPSPELVLPKLKFPTHKAINPHSSLPPPLATSILSLSLWILLFRNLICFPGWLSGKESTCQAGDTGSNPGPRRSPGEGNGNPLQYSCLENPTDRGAWWAAVHGVAASDTT